MLGAGALPAGRRRDLALLVGFAWLGAAAVRRRLRPELRGRPGSPGDRGPRARAPDLDGRAARHLRRCSSRCRICCRGRGCGRGIWALVRGWRGIRGVEDGSARPQAPLDPRQDPPAGATSTSPTLVALAIAAAAVVHFAAGVEAEALDRDDRVRLHLVPRAVRGRVLPERRTPGTCTSSRRSSWPGSTRRTRKSSTRSGCWRSAGTCSRRC